MFSNFYYKFKKFITTHLMLVVVIPVFLVGCGDANKTTDNNVDPSSNSSLSFKIPESITSSKLTTTGTLTATISINGGTPVSMTIDGTSASVTLDKVPKGSTTFTITFTFDHDSFDPLVIASASKTIEVQTGANTLSFAASDYDVSMDEDGDGLSNLDELDENSSTNPFVSDFVPPCILDTATLGNCEL